MAVTSPEDGAMACRQQLPVTRVRPGAIRRRVSTAFVTAAPLSAADPDSYPAALTSRTHVAPTALRSGRPPLRTVVIAAVHTEAALCECGTILTQYGVHQAGFLATRRKRVNVDYSSARTILGPLAIFFFCNIRSGYMVYFMHSRFVNDC